MEIVGTKTGLIENERLFFFCAAENDSCRRSALLCVDHHAAMSLLWMGEMM
jgi:hypothetical protein